MSGAHVVLTEENDTGEDGVIVTHASVNGVDVGRLAAAPKVRIGSRGDSVTTVTLVLVPSRLEVKGSEAAESTGIKIGFAADEGQ